MPSGVRAIARNWVISRERAAARQKGVLGGVGRPVGEARLDIAAEQCPRIPGDAGGERSGERADPGNRGDAEDDAGDKDAQPAEAAAQLAARQPKRVEPCGGWRHRARRAAPSRSGAVRWSSTMRPSASRIWRSQRSARL